LLAAGCARWRRWWQVVFVPELPKNAAGKIRRVDLREQSLREAQAS
jgi:acyl-coenzyme A synthetase/AMP-(fatty) acid ligase